MYILNTFIMLYLIVLLLLVWVATDVYKPYKTNLRHIEPSEIARLDAAMWRSYYEKKPLLTFLQTAELMRGQYNVPYWRSFVMAYYAARAAFVFKKGTNLPEYNKALAPLIKYFKTIRDISSSPFDVSLAATMELRWWVIRRYREQHPPAEWESCLAKAAAAIYHVDTRAFAEYARLRTVAMLLRDEKDTKITDTDWQQINNYLRQAWHSFAMALHEPVLLYA